MKLTVIYFLLMVGLSTVLSCSKDNVETVVPVVTFSTAGILINEHSDSNGSSGVEVPVVATLSQPLISELLVPLSVAGSAVRDIDYTIPYAMLRFPAGSICCTTMVSILDDFEIEINENLVLIMDVPASVGGGLQTEFTIIIESDDKPKVGTVHHDRTVSRRSGSVSVGVYLDKSSPETITVPYRVSGSALAPTHHDFIDGVFIFNPGDTLSEKFVTIVNDSMVDSFKDMVITLEVPMNADTGDYIVDSITIAYDSIVNFQLADNEISTWRQSLFDSDYRVVEGEGLYTVINGGATPYIDFHYLVAQKQTLVNPAEQDFSLMTMRYPTDADIDSMFANKKKDLDPTCIASVAGYTQDQVIGNYSNSGVTHYIRFGNMYFELALTLGGFSQMEIDSVAKEIVGWIDARTQ